MFCLILLSFFFRSAVCNEVSVSSVDQWNVLCELANATFKFDYTQFPYRWQCNKKTKDYCNWRGIKCDESNNVIEIEIGYMASFKGDVPESLTTLPNLKTFTLSPNICIYDGIFSLPDNIGDLKSLEILNVNCMYNLKSIPDSIVNLPNIVKLALVQNFNLKRLPKEIGKLTSLEELYLFYSGVVDIPDSISDLKNLKILQLDDSRIITFPYAALSLPNLETLSISSTSLVNLPENIGKLKSLRSFAMDNVVISSIPDSFGELENLQIFSASCPTFRTIPSSFGNLRNLQKLTLDCNRFHPSSLFVDFFDSLNSLKKLNELRLDYSTFEGRKLPEEGVSKQLTFFSFTNTGTQGTIPNSFNYTYPSFFGSDNQLEGDIPIALCFSENCGLSGNKLSCKSSIQDKCCHIKCV